MATAIIDTLKAKDSSGNEVEVYPRTSFRAVKNDEGKTLNAVLEGVVFVETSDESPTLTTVDIKAQLDALAERTTALEDAVLAIDESLAEIINTKTF